MATRTTRNRAVVRLTAVCALTGAALLTAVTGGQAWADGGSGAAAPAPVATATATPAPKAPEAAPAAPAAPTATPAAKGAAPAPVVSPVPKQAENGRPASPAPAPKEAGNQPQVREVPKGAAQAGDGSTAGDSSGLKLVGGGAVAAIGAAGLGFAVLRRRSGARG
ncbi:hypothetical protein ACFVFS_09295 [Kitasatospora sp. NPDC057692]|uniref:hypothetical protein n=1 Tax=Kitasatospora sp. NPDC057692 TaxID=3346215 RepID=UPI003691E915